MTKTKTPPKTMKQELLNDLLMGASVLIGRVLITLTIFGVKRLWGACR